MFRPKTHKTVYPLLLAFAGLAAPRLSLAATPVKISGAIAGVVTSSAGIPQMGATVVLYNRQDRSLERVMTNDKGEFKFAGLLPDLYSIKVVLLPFALAIRKDILVQPGMQSVLAVNLNTLFSSIQLRYPPIENGSLMTDDWKWVLRSASSTRAVMRFEDGDPLDPTPDKTARAALFTDTRGMVRVSAGDGSLVTGLGREADLGTAFALATSLYGNSLVQVSGNVGYGSQTGAPAAAVRTSYSRNFAGGSPEFSVTMRQLFLPGRLDGTLSGSDAGFPMLRTMSVGVDDRTVIDDNLSIQYGFAMDSVSFVDHLNYLSPYARVTYALDDGSTLVFAYTSGNARPDLAGSSEDSELQKSLNALGLFPAVSLRGGSPRIQQGHEYEMAYTRKAGSRTYSLSAYHESVSNATLTLVAPAGFYSGGDLLPDIFSGNSIFNAGDYQSTGFTAAVTQNLGEHVSATVMYGSQGALTADTHELVSNSPDELRSMIREGRRNAATTRVAATAPWTGTHLIASYQWAPDHRWAMPGNLYSTQAFQPMPGFNVYVRQPIPGFGKRIEATADFRNLLAQGYLPIGTVNGQRVMLVQNPRSLRGGLAFIF
jgi:hypothetical protein